MRCGLWADDICQPSCNTTDCGYSYGGGDCCDTVQ